MKDFNQKVDDNVFEEVTENQLNISVKKLFIS
jgi:hypothetical protein